MCHNSALNPKSSAGGPPAVARESFPRKLFLLWRGLLLRVSLDRLCPSLSFVFFLVLVRGRSLLYLRLLLRQLGSFEALPIKSNLSNTHRGVGLPVSAQLLVLLLALVVENQNLRAASLFHQLADH